VLAAKEEDLVERAAARRLIKLHPLGEAMAESDDLRHVAHLLDVDPALLRARLAHLHPAETAHLRRRLDG
jgi:hypothetical protein